MKNKIVSLLFVLLTVLVLSNAKVQASEAVIREEVAEVTDINDILKDIDIITVETNEKRAKAKVEEDYRTWTQDDSRWGSISLGGSEYTMKRSGCLVTSITKLIIQSELKKSSEFTPKTLVTWLNKNGGFTSGGGLYWGKPAEYVSGLTYVGDIIAKGEYQSAQYDDKFISWINEGYHLVVQVKNGGHWVAVDEAQTLANGKIYIMDSIPENVNADIALTDRYKTFNRVGAYKGGKTPEVILEAPVLQVKAESETANNANLLLTWTKSREYKEGYLIERSLTGDVEDESAWEVVKDIQNRDTLRWIDNKVESETTYYYRIRPYNENKETGPESNVVKITTRHVHEYKRTIHEKATTEKDGKFKDTCKKCGYIKYPVIYKIDSVTLKNTTFTYNGKIKKPGVIVKNRKGSEISSEYYTVTYQEGRKKVGKYKVTIKFKDKYSGKVVCYFKINPKKTTITKLTAGNKTFTASWKKVENQISGYEIHFTPIKGPSDNYKIEKVGAKKVSAKINVVRANSNYYVKIRTYKVVDGVTYRSGWSEVKTIRTK